MDFEQIADRDKVEELARESATLSAGLKSAEQNVQTLKNKLAGCNEEIISLAIRNDNHVAAIRFANMMTTQTLIFVIAKSTVSILNLEARLPTSSPEQEQEIKMMISQYTERIALYHQIYQTRELGINR
jgi:hypothetical protein